METEAEATPPSASSLSAAYPSWLMLGRYGGGDDDEYYRFTGDDKIAAACFTSDGQPIRVSLRIAAPPATSLLCVHCPVGGISTRPNIIAAHGDSLLIQIYFSRRWADPNYTVGTFVYSAGAGHSSRPPSLRLLPCCYFVDKMIGRSTEDQRGFFMEVRRVHTDRPRLLDQYNATGLLRRGRDGLVVAELKMAPRQPSSSCSALASGASSGRRSVMETWTLRMDIMVWEMDATIDATEPYALDAWKGLPRVQLECPVVSIEDPMVISFVVCEGREQWMILVDTRSRTVQAVSRGPDLRRVHYDPETTIPSRFSSYLNSYPRGGSAISLPVP
ncbi:hypothetical protein EJB05_54676, partial [Eragrostis curvula]